ncbi:dihydrofolate reductase family protein [Actinoplanes sp. NPDC048796]
MAGGTTFHFVTGGVDEALKRAIEASGDGTIAVAGGATTVNQFLRAGLIDELRLHIAPVTVGAGARLFDGVPPLNLERISSRAASLVTHVTYTIKR